MSLKAMDYTWDTSYSGALKLMLLAIADRANDDGVCYPGVSSLAKKCGIAKRSVQKQLTRLEELGEIVTQVQAGTTSKSGNTNLYYMKNYRKMRGLETPNLGTRLDQCITSSLCEGVSDTTSHENKGVPKSTPQGVSNKTPDGVSKSTPNTTTDSSLKEKDSALDAQGEVEEPKLSTSPDEPKEPEPTLEDVSEQDPVEPQNPDIAENAKPAPKLDKVTRYAWYDAVHDVFGESGGLNGKYQKLLRGEFTDKKEGDWLEYQMPADSGLTPDSLREWGRQHKRDNPDQVMIKQPIKIQSKLLTFLGAQQKQAHTHRPPPKPPANLDLLKEQGSVKDVA